MKKILFLFALYIFGMTKGAELIYDAIVNITFINNHLLCIALSNFINYLILSASGLLILKSEMEFDFRFFKDQPAKVGSVVKGYFILIFGSAIGNMILNLIDYQDKSINQQGIEILLKSDNLVIIITAVALLIGPIIEELIFRKCFIDLFVLKWKFSPILIVITSSLLFGAIHVIFNIEDNIEELILIIPYFFQGLALGYLYIRNNYNIYIPLFVHILNNLIATIVILTTS